MKKILTAVTLSLVTVSTAFSADYCLGIRGNGDFAPAHWTALSRIVREVGMPTNVSAGSSGTYSAFLLESVAMNRSLEYVSEQSKLVETFPVYLNAFLEVSGAAQILSGEAGFGDYLKVLPYLKILNPQLFSVKGLVAKNFKISATESIKYLGGFDAAGDDNLFVREGVVDFKMVAISLLGRMGDLYAGNTDDDFKLRLKTFTRQCSKYKKLGPKCKASFKQIAKDYIKSSNPENRKSKRAFDKLGKRIKTYISTGLILGDGVKRVEQVKRAFRNQSGNHKALVQNMKFDFKNEMAFGYFGDAAGLNMINANLDKRRDLKSAKYRSIGPANWFEAMSVSPAEPGLANLQKIPSRNGALGISLNGIIPLRSLRWTGLRYRTDMISAGGWSDLHPMQVLKAKGCDKIMYLTRENGESVFAQQLFIRLAGETGKVPFWKDIQKYNREGWNSSRRGWIAATENSAWNQLYNLGNKNSSFSRAIRMADAVYCTDWDRQSLGELDKMLDDAFEAPTFLKRGVSEEFRINPVGRDANGQGYPGCVPKR
jgi:hypothetical protein